MSKYIVEHVHHAEAFFVYKKSSLFGIKEALKGFYYPHNASLEQMKQSKQKAFDYIKMLEELD